jgi:hypothetical protein
VPSVAVAVCPPTVDGLRVAVGGVSVRVVIPSGQVTATAQASCSWLWLAVAVLLMSFVLDAVASELELLSAVFVFEFVCTNIALLVTNGINRVEKIVIKDILYETRY